MNYKTFFKKAKEKGLTNIQVTEKQTIDSSVEIINSKMESFDDYNNIDYHIKAEYNGKTVKTSCNYLDTNILNLLILKAKKTDSYYEDEYLSNRKSIPKNKPLNFDISKEIMLLKGLDELKKEYDQVQKLTTYFSETYTNTRIINSNGVDISTDSHLCSFVVEAIAENNGEFTSYDRKVLETDKSKIDFISVTKDVLEKVMIQSNKIKLTTKKYTVLLDSYVAGKIISNITNMLSATSIRNKVSCLEKSLNKKVFSEKLTIIEDPNNKNYPGYRLFDDEGTATVKKFIIKEGVVNTILYDIKEAKLKSVEPTGNSYQGIGTKNMYVEPGKKSNLELIKSIKDGIYIIDYMGSMGSAISSVTGAISIQVFGFKVKDGVIVSGINPAIMTTTIFELLTNISEISSELKFTNTNSASPALLIDDISIAS